MLLEMTLAFGVQVHEAHEAHRHEYVASTSMAKTVRLMKEFQYRRQESQF